MERKNVALSFYKKARERQVSMLKRGFNLGTKGRITISREELHDRLLSENLSHGQIINGIKIKNPFL